MTDEELTYYIWLKNIPGIGLHTQKKLMTVIGKPHDIWDAARDGEISSFFSEGKLKGMTKRRVEHICENLNLDGAKRIYDDCRKKDIGILTMEDGIFPNRLKCIEEMPIMLYYKGNIRSDINNEMCTAGIVGARRCLKKDKDNAVRIADKLMDKGVVIISGLAKGIDSYAHTSSICRGAYTIAVLGNGADVCYPREHSLLMQRISERGLVLSEYEPCVQPRRYHFPQRNRIIAALSDELYVIGAGRNSGALITADFAHKYGKCVCMLETGKESKAKEDRL